ncbi:type IV pilus twitching motility protein PilT [Clostridium merdae]|uniref:type IV pilus twitching motility protein PilT n=1 Tax=Clostridium merdae TaxID=1958780 RepID=UPI000A26F7A8|nr:PilT/PilU family type 4a pilus ATPase [Clostridium merdae]
MEILEMLQTAVSKGASDIFIISGCPVSYKIHDIIQPMNEEKLMPDTTKHIISTIFALAGQRDFSAFLIKGDDDFSFSIPKLGRFRCNAYLQRNSCAAVLRILGFELPKPHALHIPQAVMDIATKERGLVLITGPAGSGKTTTLACLIEQINQTRNSHIITIEDPIEFLHPHNKSIVSQREIENDTKGYLQALRAALRQAPNVILIGEMRDYETISTAVTAAETGQLILSTLHTLGASNAIDRIIDVFPENQQYQIRVQLSMVLQAIVSQQLIPSLDGTLVPAFEILLINNAIRNMIREAKTHQIDNAISANAAIGMLSMDNDLLRLHREGIISKDSALTYCSNVELMSKKLSTLN